MARDLYSRLDPALKKALKEKPDDRALNSAIGFVRLYVFITSDFQQ